MDKKQSVEKRAIIQNGIASIPIGFLCGGPVGALTVAGATALMAHIEEQKDQELRQKEWERKHPAPPTIEEQMEKEQARANRARRYKEAIKFFNKRFPYKQYEVRTVDPTKSLYGIDNCVNGIQVFILYNEEESPLLFPTYEKYMCGTVYGFDEFYRRLMIDKDKPGFTSYIINARMKGHTVNYMYTVDNINYFLY